MIQIMALKKVNKQGADNCSPDAEKSGFGMISFKPSASDLSEYWLDLDKESAPLDFLFHIDVTERLLARGNVQVVKGREKTGKSAYGILLMTSALKGEFLGVRPERPDLNVLWVDTEQDEATLRKRAIKVCEMAGIPHDDPRFSILALKKAAIDERLDLLLAGIEEKKPDFVFLDGLVDLCTDFNDNTECFALVSDLIKVAEQQNCAILCVIHSNKAGNEARGHLGSILQQKSSEVYLLKRPVRGAVATVQQELTRFAEVPDISFRFGEDFALLSVDDNQDGLKCIFARLFAKQSEYRYTELCEAFAAEVKLRVDTAKKKISYAVAKGILLKETTCGGTKYFLNVLPKEEVA